MAFEPALPEVMRGLSGLVFMVVGVWVLAQARRAPQVTGFAVYCLFFGAVFVYRNVANMFGIDMDNEWQWPLSYGVAIALVFMAWHLPHTLRRGRRTALWVAMGLSLLLMAAYVAIGISGVIGPVDWGWPVFQGIAFVGLNAFAATLLLRRLAEAGEPDARRDTALIAVAVSFYSGAVTGQAMYGWLPVSNGWLVAGRLGPSLVVFGLAVSLLFASDGLARQSGRRILMTFMGAMLAGFVYFAWTPTDGLAQELFRALTRFAMLGILAYAVLRHQMLGIDVKFRWGVSKTTVAGIFIAVFFVVSESAQQWFGQETGNEYWGIAGAGLLVFGIAPLQRFADRFAARAIPVSPAETDAKMQVFEDAVRLAMRDRQLSPEEQLKLSRLAEALGIGAGTAAAMLIQGLDEQA